MRWKKAYRGLFPFLFLLILICLLVGWFISGKRNLVQQQLLARERLMKQVDLVFLLMDKKLEVDFVNLVEGGSRIRVQFYTKFQRKLQDSDPKRFSNQLPGIIKFPDKRMWMYFQIHEDGHVDVSLPSQYAAVEPMEEQRYEAFIDQLTSISGEILDMVDAREMSGARPFLEKAGSQYLNNPVKPMNFYTLSMGGAKYLAVLRKASLPQESLVMGFVVSVPEIERGLKNSFFPVTFQSDEVSADGKKSMLVAGTGWYLVLDYQEALASLRMEERIAWKKFYREAVLWLIVVVVLGLFMFRVMWQEAQIVRQRAVFVMSAAHQFKTPLASIQASGEMLEDGESSSPRVKKYARNIALEAKRLGKLISDMLNVTVMERGDFTVQRERGDLGVAVRDAVERYRDVVEAKGARVQLVIQDGLPLASFDLDAVNHILQNLLDNAEKYSRSAKDRTIDVWLQEQEGRLRLSVRDHGSGLQEKMNTLIKPFVRGRGNQPPGLGLGLSVIQALARAHGATFTGENAPGGGALFTISFPACGLFA